MTVCLVTGVAVWAALGAWLVLRLVRAFRERKRLDVAGRWVVVTGCDSGFGRGVVEDLAARKARVVACCFTEEGATAALAAGAEQAPRLDLTDTDALTALVTDVRTWCRGHLWGLVHNAGTVLPGFVEYQPDAFYRRVMDVNFFAPVSLTRQLLPEIRAQQGRVVLVSSVDGLVSLPGNAPYDASKFAVEAYADALRTELAFWNIRVSVVNPSTMRTPLAITFFEGHRQAWEAMQAEDPDGSWQQIWTREWLDRYVDANAQQLDRIAEDPRSAIRDIVHALTAAFPRTRYLSGRLSKTLFWALWSAPESWSHRFKRAMIQPPPPGIEARRSWLPLGLTAGLVLAGLVIGAWAFLPGSGDLHVTGTLHVNVNVSDFERSRSFYERLGFVAVMDVEPHGTEEVAAAVGLEPYVVKGALLAHPDGSMIDLLEWEQPRDDAPPNAALNHLGLARIAFTTTDLDADVARLREAGVSFLSEQPGEVADGLGGTTRFICFRDPDGTVLELVEMGALMGWLSGAAQALR